MCAVGKLAENTIVGRAVGAGGRDPMTPLAGQINPLVKKAKDKGTLLTAAAPQSAAGTMLGAY